MLLFGSRDSAGTKVAAPSTSPKRAVPATASGTAKAKGSAASSECKRSAPRMQKPPCARLTMPVTLKTSDSPSAITANTLPCTSPPMTIWVK